jgi:hypothetical protein
MYDPKDYIPREISNPLTEIGFDERTPLFWCELPSGLDILILARDAVHSFDVCAPSHTQVFRWLSRKYSRTANIIYDNEMNNYFFEHCYCGGGFKKSFLPLQYDSEGDVNYDYGRFDSYFEAANACILDIINDIKNKAK